MDGSWSRHANDAASEEGIRIPSGASLWRRRPRMDIFGQNKPDQKVLSDRVKTAIKTALAVVLAYGVALSMDWGHSYWAAFAVAFCTLSTVGESLNKGLLRLAGTLLASLAAVTLIAL